VTHLSQCVSLWTIDVKFSVSSSSLQPTIVLSRIYSSYNSFLARTSQISPFYNSWITARFFQEIYLLSLSWRISMSMRVVKDNWSKYTCHADNIQFSTGVNQVYCPCHGSTVRTTLSELVRYIVVPPIFVTLEYLQSKLLIVFVVTYLSQCVSLRTIEVIIPCCANNIQYSQMESTRYRLVTKLQTVQLFPSSYMTWSLDYLVTDPQFVQLFPSSYVTAYHRVFSRKNYNEGLHWNYMSFFVTHLINACRCRQSG
jgi:hypothetical protein